jgi:hypothetical protein
VGEFEVALREQVVAASRELAAARAARDYAGIKSFGLRLRYLLEIAQEHHVQLPEDEQPDAPQAAADQGGE